MLGDCNGDGIVNKLDSDLVANVLVGNLTTIPKRTDCDVNKDGVVDVKDALIVLQYAVGLRPNLGGSPLQVIGVIPLDNSVNFNPTKPISLFFSNSLNPATVSTATVRLIDTVTSQVVTVSIIPSQQNLVLTLSPLQPLNQGRTYTVSVSTTVRDSLGSVLSVAFSSRFTTAGAVQLVYISGNGQSAPINSILSDPLVVQAQGGAGVPIPGITVTFQVNLGDGEFAPSGLRRLDVITDSAGNASVNLLLGAQATQQSVDAWANGFGSTVTFSANAMPKESRSLRITVGNNQNCEVGGDAPIALTVRAMDEGGNGIVSTPINFSIIRGAGFFDGTGSAITKFTDSSGAASTIFNCQSQKNITVKAEFPTMIGYAPLFNLQGFAPSAGPTGIIGTILDNALKPIPGMKVYLLSNPQVQTLSGADGSFRLAPVPSQLQTVKIDAMATPPIAGKLYADLAYEIVVVPGHDNPIPMPILLPELDVQSTLDVTASQGGTLTLRANPLWKVVVSPGQTIFPNGTRSGRLWVTTVPAARIPMPPADGKYSNFFVAVEPPAVRFSPPAQVTFPNVDGSQPGAVVNIVSYDHALALFTPIGRGKVSEDGKTITSLPGSGLVHGGWHYPEPPVPPETGQIECEGCDGGTMSLGGQSVTFNSVGVLPNLPPQTPASLAVTCPVNGVQCGSEEMDPQTECCVNAVRRSKFLILELDDCPNRVANPNKIPGTDGCSVPWPLNKLVNKDNPTGGIDTYFAGPGKNIGPCDVHDFCYRRCNSDRNQCDTTFGAQMRQVCQNSAHIPSRAPCMTYANIYESAVIRFGLDPWTDAQKSHCQCCP